MSIPGVSHQFSSPSSTSVELPAGTDFCPRCGTGTLRVPEAETLRAPGYRAFVCDECGWTTGNIPVDPLDADNHEPGVRNARA